MKLDIRLFATLKDRARVSKVSVEVNEPATVSDMLAAITNQNPVLKPALQSTLVAVNQEYAELTQPIHSGDEIALFPPVSGG